jgi:hypothetical protein
MNTYDRPTVRPFLVLIALVALPGCQSALIYGERTSFNLAAVRLNDDIAEPVKINIGLSRSVGTMAPPRGGNVQSTPTTDGGAKTKDAKVDSGEAVSVFSSFDLQYVTGSGTTPTLPLVDGDLSIVTRFASGQAAINISDHAPTVNAIVRPRTLPDESPDARVRKDRLLACVRGIDDRGKIDAIAKAVDATINKDSVVGTRASIVTRIRRANATQLGQVESSLKSSCP